MLWNNEIPQKLINVILNLMAIFDFYQAFETRRKTNKTFSDD